MQTSEIMGVNTIFNIAINANMDVHVKIHIDTEMHIMDKRGINANTHANKQLNT